MKLLLLFALGAIAPRAQEVEGPAHALPLEGPAHARSLAGPAPTLHSAAPKAAAPRIEVSIAAGAHAGPVTGRLIVLVAKDSTPEPRMTVSPRGPALFAVDINALEPGHTAVVDESATSYPMALSELPAGDYYVEAVVDVYTQAHRSDGHTIWVHLNDGTIETFNRSAGNLYSDVHRMHVGSGGTVHLDVTHVMLARPRDPDTEWLKHVRIQSQKLTQFWGRPIYINASVLLPKGYAEHPTAYYPSVYALGHAPRPFSFSPQPDSIDPKDAEVRRGATIDKTGGLENGYDFYKSWTSDGFPRVIAITLEQQTPYFPDSYSVNSVNNGPYGDAVIEEVMPYLEEHFRIIRQPYARQIEGASTSGWQTLALALQHPDFFGDAWVLQPDPIDFRHYQLVNVYDDSNAFSVSTGPFTKAERTFQRTVTGRVQITARELSRFESVLGTHCHSSYQLEAWEAVYGPIGPDGYPVPLWDKATGKIDHTVAAYMRDHGFDLRDYAERNWATLGPKLTGKLHFFCGDMDNYYLNLAVYDFEDFLQRVHFDADFTYGRPMKGHGWHSFTWAEMVRKMGAAMKAQAPRGEDTNAWNY